MSITRKCKRAHRFWLVAYKKMEEARVDFESRDMAYYAAIAQNALDDAAAQTMRQEIAEAHARYRHAQGIAEYYRTRIMTLDRSLPLGLRGKWRP